MKKKPLEIVISVVAAIVVGLIIFLIVAVWWYKRKRQKVLNEILITNYEIYDENGIDDKKIDKESLDDNQIENVTKLLKKYNFYVKSLNDLKSEINRQQEEIEVDRDSFGPRNYSWWADNDVNTDPLDKKNEDKLIKYKYKIDKIKAIIEKENFDKDVSEPSEIEFLGYENEDEIEL